MEVPRKALWCKNHKNPRDRNSHARAPKKKRNRKPEEMKKNWVPTLERQE
jgi:hypothetical protein